MISGISAQGIPSKYCFYVKNTTLFTTYLFKDLLSCTSPQQSNSRLRRTASTEYMGETLLMLMYPVFLICYQARDTGLSTGPSTVLRNFGQYVTTLVYLNSSLNPLIYSWKMSRIRQAIVEILRNILPCTSTPVTRKN